jgi:uncharacterized membrane protein
MKTNEEKYIWGLFYFDRSDSRVIVPKINRWMGWTFNFARPEAYLIIAALIVIIIFVSRYS